jgi:hypothetical protein
MKTSTNSTPAATDQATVVLNRMTRRAVTTYDRERRRYERSLADLESIHDCAADVLTDLTWDRMSRAQEHLVHCLLSRGEGHGNIFTSHKRVCRSRGVQVGDKVYLAVCDRDQNDLPEGTENDGLDVMWLVIIPTEDIETI